MHDKLPSAAEQMPAEIAKYPEVAEDIKAKMEEIHGMWDGLIKEVSNCYVCEV